MQTSCRLPPEFYSTVLSVLELIMISEVLFLFVLYVLILMIFNTCISAVCTVYGFLLLFKFVIALRYVLLCYFVFLVLLCVLV